MYNYPYYIPGYNAMIPPTNLLRGTPLIRGTIPQIGTLTNTVKTTGGLFSKLGSSLSGIKSINWGGLINNTSKTLGIINQTIPMVRQVGPMVNNMKSMLRVASLFKDETDIKKTPSNKNNPNTKNNSIYKPTINSNITKPTITQNNQTTNTKNTTEYDESPTFFINT